MANKLNNPFLEFDVSKVFGDFKVPGVDVESVLSAHRKNIEAVTTANQAAFEGLQAVFRRQAEIVRSSVEDASSYVNQVIAAGSPEEKAARQAEIVKTAFESALSNVKELAELVAKSNNEAAEILTKRVSESLEEVKSAIGKTAK